MSTTRGKDGIGYWIKIAIWIAVSFSGWFIPATGTITEYGMKVVGIFIGLMFGWICLDLIFPSFFAIILMSFAGEVATQSLFFKGFAYNVCVIIFVLCTFTAYVQHVKLDEALAKWVTNLKFLEGKPWLFITAYMVLIFALGYLINIYACIFVMWPIAYAICDELGYEKRSPFASYMLFAATYICGLGMVSKPMDAWALIGLTALTEATGIEVNYLLYSTYMLIIAALCIVAYIILGKYVMKIDVSKLANKKCTGEKIVLNTDQKIGIGVLAAFLIIMYAPSVLPKAWLLTGICKRMGVIGVAALFCIILGAWRRNGNAICDVAKLATKGVPFSIVFLMCANCVVIDGLQAQETGVIPWLGETFSPLLAGMSPLVFYLFLIVLYGVLTQLVHNVVLLSVFVPISIQFGTMIGANPIVTTFLGIVVLSCALATAGASSRSGLVFGNTEWIDMKWAYFLGIGNVILCMLIMFVIGVPLGNLMFPV